MNFFGCRHRRVVTGRHDINHAIFAVFVDIDVKRAAEFRYFADHVVPNIIFPSFLRFFIWIEHIWQLEQIRFFNWDFWIKIGDINYFGIAGSRKKILSPSFSDKYLWPVQFFPKKLSQNNSRHLQNWSPVFLYGRGCTEILKKYFSQLPCDVHFHRRSMSTCRYNWLETERVWQHLGVPIFEVRKPHRFSLYRLRCTNPYFGHVRHFECPRSYH